MAIVAISFVVQFAIVDNRAVLDQPNYYPVYRVRVCLRLLFLLRAFQCLMRIDSRTAVVAAHPQIIVAGTGIAFTATYQKPGVYSESVRAPAERMIGTVRVELMNERGEVYTDSFTLGFNVYFYRVLKVRPRARGGPRKGGVRGLTDAPRAALGCALGQWLVVTPFVAVATVLLFAKQLSLPDLPQWTGLLG